MGNRICLIETTENDYDIYYKLRCSPSDIFWNGYTDKPDKEEFHKIYLQRISSSRFSFPEDRRIYFIGIDEPNSSDIVGFVQLIMKTNYIEISYSVIELYQNKGYATQALYKAVVKAQEFGKKVCVRIRDDNIASQKVAKNNGFIATDYYELIDYPKVGIIRLRLYEYQNISK